MNKSIIRKYKTKLILNEPDIADRQCPNCNTKYEGIPIVKTKFEGFLRIRHYDVQCYKCKQCGTSWEGHPYLIKTIK